MDIQKSMKYQYDVFVSYTDADRKWVEGYLLDALEKAGVRHHSEEAFELGKPRLVAFEEAIKHSKWTLLVLSPAYLADDDSIRQFADLLSQSYSLETGTKSVIPLKLKPVKLPPRLSSLVNLDATDPEKWPNAIARLCEELQCPVPEPSPPPSCPYPGMEQFRKDTEYARFFYGRKDEIGKMLRHLRHHRFLCIIGPSGSGKSSLVSAGFLMKLSEGGYFSENFWCVKQMRPGSQPLHTLTRLLGGDPKQPTSAIDRLLEDPPPSQRLLLVIDQFEELFTQTDRDEQQRFIEVIQTLRTVNTCALILVMRADFYPDLMNSPLWPVDASQRLEIAPLRGQALRQAIEQPAADMGVYLESGLVERLLADAADEPGMLPFLQETMVLLWGEMQRRLIPLSAYQQLGSEGESGLTVAMKTRADAALVDLSPEQQAIARRIFLRLIQFGEGRADTRRQQPVDALRSAGDDPVIFDRTLDHLTQNRLLTLSGEEKESEQEEEEVGRKVDIAHEALISSWPRLQEWLSERREAEQTRRRLEAKVNEWIRLGQRKGGLLDEAELPEAERWLESPDASDLGYNANLPALVQISRTTIEDVRRKELENAHRLAEEARARYAAKEKARRELEKRAEQKARTTRRLWGLVRALFTLVVFGMLRTCWQAGQMQQLDEQILESAVKLQKQAESNKKWTEKILEDTKHQLTRAREALASSKYAETRYILAEIYYRQGKYEDAVREYEQAVQDGLEETEEVASFLNKLGEALINRDIDVNKGLAYTQKYLKLSPNQKPELAFKSLAIGYSKHGLYSKAIEALYNLAKVCLKQNKHKQAVEIYRELIRAYPELEEAIVSSEYGEAHYCLGMMYYNQQKYLGMGLGLYNDYNQQKYKEAIREYEQAIQYRFDDDKVLASSLNKLAWELIKREIYVAKGIEYAQKSLEFDPKNFHTMNTLALGYSKKGKYPEAVEALYNLGKVCLKQNKYLEAFDAYRALIKKYPELERAITSSKYAEVHYILGKIYYNREEYSEAVREYKHAIQYEFDDDKVHASSLNSLAWTLIERDMDVDKGVEYALQSLELDPDQNPARAMDTLALGYIKQERHAEAVELLKQALEKAPDDESRQILQERMQQAQEGLEK